LSITHISNIQKSKIGLILILHKVQFTTRKHALQYKTNTIHIQRQKIMLTYKIEKSLITFFNFCSSKYTYVVQKIDLETNQTHYV